MFLKKIRIQCFGAISSFSCAFSDGVNVLRYDTQSEIADALRIVLNHRTPPLSSYPIEADTRLDAEVLIKNVAYRVCITSNDSGLLAYRCFDESGNDITEEYLYVTSHCHEHDLSEIFSGDGTDLCPSFLKYAGEDLYFFPRELSGRTDGLSDLKVFRAYLRSFIEGFEPELIRDGKQYEMFIDKRGRYAVRCRIDSSIAKTLSIAERTLFRYLCFLRTAEFWHGFEALRNLNYVKKPLIIQGFLERLDESIDVRPLIERTEKLKRQVILFAAPDSI